MEPHVRRSVVSRNVRCLYAVFRIILCPRFKLYYHLFRSEPSFLGSSNWPIGKNVCLCSNLFKLLLISNNFCSITVIAIVRSVIISQILETVNLFNSCIIFDMTVRTAKPKSYAANFYKIFTSSYKKKCKSTGL